MASSTDCKREATRHIYSFYPQHKQINAALGITQDADVIADFISRVKARCDEYEAQISVGETPEIDFSNITP